MINITYITQLTSGVSMSRGISKGEQKIKSILQKEKIPFFREYVCQNLRNNLYRFDFYIPEVNSAIEYNGRQHYEYIKFFYKNKAEFLKAKERDRIKISYAAANNILLYVIPFWEENNLHNSADLFNQKFLATDKFFNDTLWRNYQKDRPT